MSGKPNISTKLRAWDEYQGKPAPETAAAVYDKITETSLTICTWYWTSIKTKRMTSLAARGLAFAGLAGGTALPLLAALRSSDTDKLLFTQWGVGLLAMAGLLLAADRIFGWSSGWMRYITTVTTMENLTRAFQLEWGRLLLTKGAPLESSDAKALYELGASLEQELIKLQAEETIKWCSEFNTGMSLLETMIKSQREETDKKLDAIRTSLVGREQDDEVADKAKLPGAIEVTLSHTSDIKTVQIALDLEAPVSFKGTAWSRREISPGIHVLRLQTIEDHPVVVEKAIDVASSKVSRIEIQLN